MKARFCQFWFMRRASVNVTVRTQRRTETANLSELLCQIHQMSSAGDFKGREIFLAVF